MKISILVKGIISPDSLGTNIMKSVLALKSPWNSEMIVSVYVPSEAHITSNRYLTTIEAEVDMRGDIAPKILADAVELEIRKVYRLSHITVRVDGINLGQFRREHYEYPPEERKPMT